MTNIRALLAANIKKRRRFLGISQEKLAENVSTSPNHIAQIEQENKFPSPKLIERIAVALDLDTPDLFSKDPFSDEAVKQFQDGVMSDMGIALQKALAQTITARIEELKKVKPTKKRVSKKAKPK
jgi:transcriptional regulator with XRE-family HTH domain